MDNSDWLIKLQQGSLRAKAWYALSAPTWKNRLKKFLRAKVAYVFYQISRRQPRAVQVKTFWNENFNCYLPDYFLTQLYGVIGHPAEIRLTHYLLRALKSHDVFFDVGASCGFYAILAARLVGNSGSVHAFEPTPFVFSLLETNAKLHANITASQIAVADKVGTMRLRQNPQSLVANSLTSGVATEESILVPTTTIDTYCENASTVPTLIKIDVEGAEDLVIAGASELLRGHAPRIIMEIWAQHNAAHLRAADALIRLGYHPYVIGKNGEEIPCVIDKDNMRFPMQDGEATQDVFDNFLFKKDQRG